MNVLLALLGILFAGASGLLAVVFCGKRDRSAAVLSCGAMLVGAGCGISAAVRGMLGYGDLATNAAWLVPGGAFALRLDPIAGIFLAQVFLIGALGSVYGIEYWSASHHPGSGGRLRVFFGLIVAGMALLVIARNSILFLVGWEIMALAAFLALTADDRSPKTREAGIVYLVSTRIGTLALFAMFAVLHVATSSFALPDGTVAARSSLGTAIFCLGLLGFGLKAGVMPLHLWLPGAHANAPTHVSALMSGVLIKMGIYGLVRLGSFFDVIPLWWGVVVFALGAVSALLGVAFALGQHDIKRLLAYHSVENIGIIVMSLGVALLGRSLSRPELLALGLAGALLHTFNHGLFKSLLFFCAGSVITGAGTREIDVLGGLAKRMRFTALAFLVGATAICGLPPLNGFVSELCLYLGMLHSVRLGAGPIGSLLLFGVAILAMVGALAVACFVKVHGVVFLGEPRSHASDDARESPRLMLLPMALLAAFCVLIGTFPLLVVTILQNAIAAWSAASSPSALSTLVPFVPLMWSNLGLLVLILVVAGVLAWRVPRSAVADGPTWDCGYVAPSPRMQYTASSFADELVTLFAAALRPRSTSPILGEPFPRKSHFGSHVPEVVLDLLVMPGLRNLLRTANWFRWIQPGSIHLYIVYVLITLVVMLFVWH